MEKAKQEYQTYVSDYFRRGAMREMGDDERETIIDGERISRNLFWFDYFGV